jgi:hypothetical protein
MLLDGNIVLTAKSLSGLVPTPRAMSRVRDSKPDAFRGCNDTVRTDNCRAVNTTPEEGRREKRESIQPNRSVPACSRILASQAHLHTPGRTESPSALDRESRAGRVLPGGRPSLSSRMKGLSAMAAKPYFCSLSYFSLTLCCVTPCSRWRGGHATLHSAGAGLSMPVTGRPVGYRRDRLAPCRARPWPRHFFTHLPDVGQALKLYPLSNAITNLGRKFVQGQIGPIDCKEEMECKSFDSVRACGSEGCEKRLRREGRGYSRPSHLFIHRLRPVFP